MFYIFLFLMCGWTSWKIVIIIIYDSSSLVYNIKCKYHCNIFSSYFKHLGKTSGRKKSFKIGNKIKMIVCWKFGNLYLIERKENWKKRKNLKFRCKKLTSVCKKEFLKRLMSICVCTYVHVYYSVCVFVC